MPDRVESFREVKKRENSSKSGLGVMEAIGNHLRKGEKLDSQERRGRKLAWELERRERD